MLRVDIENLDDDEILPVHRQVVDWTVPGMPSDEAVTNSDGTVYPSTGIDTSKRKKSTGHLDGTDTLGGAPKRATYGWAPAAVIDEV